MSPIRIYMKRYHSKAFNVLAFKMKNGDAGAAEKLFNHFSVLIFRFLMARTLNRALSEDLTQEVFLRVVAHIESFDDKKGDFSVWIWKITRNILIDYFRAKKEILSLEEKQEISEEKQENHRSFGNFENRIENKLRMEKILEEIKKFSEEDREIFTLFYLSDMRYKEISQIIGKSEGALRVAVHRLTKKIKEKF